jgi:hypothetical protein
VVTAAVVAVVVAVVAAVVDLVVVADVGAVFAEAARLVDIAPFANASPPVRPATAATLAINVARRAPRAGCRRVAAERRPPAARAASKAATRSAAVMGASALSVLLSMLPRMDHPARHDLRAS